MLQFILLIAIIYSREQDKKKIVETILRLNLLCIYFGFILTKTIISEKISKNNFFLKYILWYIFIIQNLLKNLNIALILIKKWLSIFLYSFFWALVFEKFVKTSWKFLSNASIVLSLEFELLFTLFLFTFTFSVHHRPRSVSMLKCTKWTLKSFKTKLNQQRTYSSSPLVYSAVVVIIGLHLTRMDENNSK